MEEKEGQKVKVEGEVVPLEREREAVPLERERERERDCSATRMRESASSTL